MDKYEETLRDFLRHYNADKEDQAQQKKLLASKQKSSAMSDIMTGAPATNADASKNIDQELREEESKDGESDQVEEGGAKRIKTN